MEQNKENKERYGIIYKIENTVNGKVYIGQTTSSFNKRYKREGVGIERVYNHHKSLKEHNRYYNDHLLRSIEKYGFEAFDVIEEFDVAYSKEELDSLEKKYIIEFDCINNGYNHEDGGSNGRPSEETCKKISEARKGKYIGENNPNYGNHKLAGENNPMYGKKHTEQTRQKRSNNHWNCKGENHPLYGKHHSEEERIKISESLKGKKCGENSPRARKIICLNDNKIFNTLKECTEYYKLKKITIIRICKGITKKSRTGLIFMYYDEYLQQQEQQDQAVI